MLDAQHAPGPETSGTASLRTVCNGGLITVSLTPPIINLLVRKAWKYLSTVALQPDGKIGYVQPIGEKAIPGQVVDANSTSNFGVGAFLLAACEGTLSGITYSALNSYKVVMPEVFFLSAH